MMGETGEQGTHQSPHEGSLESRELHRCQRFRGVHSISKLRLG